MSKKMDRKAQLQKELTAIEKEEAKSVVQENYPRIKNKYEGKFFKIDNGYSNNERWWLYIKVVQIKPEDVYDTKGNGITSHFSGWSFQTDTYEQVTIEQVRRGYIHHVGKEITKSQFYKEFNKVLSKLQKLNQ